jgi:hypothetical protein
MTVHQGTIIVRPWDEEAGGLKDKSSHTFSSLDELFDLCLGSVTPTAVDRIVLQGVDQAGYPHTVTLKLVAVARPEDEA